MTESHGTANRGKAMGLSPEDTLLQGICRTSKIFRTTFLMPDDLNGKRPVEWFLSNINTVLGQYPACQFTKGVRILGIQAMPLPVQGAFYCLCELFLARSLKPVDSSSFVTPAALDAFENGIDSLLGQGIAIAVAVNKPEDSQVDTSNYLLSPDACRALFHGRKDLIRPAVTARFGSLVRWQSIRVKDLCFPDILMDRLDLITRAVSADYFERVVRELKDKGMRGGVTGLLYGPPGTGKTKFVRQLARVTRRDLLMVDCARLDASYYGEKPRNFRDLFRLARYVSALAARVPIIFFDEADSLLGRRVDARGSADKEENTSVNTILEELNTFSGILLAATNFIANLDPAMGRRFLLKVEFPAPSRDVLARIWRDKLPWITTEDAEALAERFPLSGGIIDNVAALCLLERIIDGTSPTLDRILRHCAEQRGQGSSVPIGFRR